MNFLATRLISKLPRDILFIEGSQLREFHKFSKLCLNGVECGPSVLAHTDDLNFSSTNHVHTDTTRASCSKPVCSNRFNIKDNRIWIEKGSASVICQRYSSSDKQSSAKSSNKSIVEAKDSPYAQLTVGQKVKEAGKDATYIVVIIIGIAVTGLMFYLIGRELFSSQSPSGVYGDALKKCQNNIEVAAFLGEPIKGYGETTRRGRRRHVSHTEFDVNGIPHMRLKFYIEGPYRKAVVYVEVQQAESGKYDYRYLVVETEGYPHRTFILEDNR